MPKSELPPPVFTRNIAHALYDGDAYREMVSLVARAERSVRLDMFLFGGPVAHAMIDLLVAKQAQGVTVQITLDRALGVLPLVRKECRVAYQRLRQEGLDVLLSDVRGLPDTPRHPGVTHNKIIVVDEREAMVGGMNVGTPFFRHHDVMIYLKGPAAAALANQFDYDRQFIRDPSLARPEGSVALSPSAGEAADFGGQTLARILGTGVGRRTTKEAILQNLRAARYSVSIAMSEIGRTSALDEVIAAHKRGVQVRVMVDPQDMYEYLPPLLGPMRRSWPKTMLNAHAVRSLLSAGVTVRFFAVGKDFAMLHMKMAIFDDRYAIVGSTNWTRGGFEWVGETDIELRGGAVITELFAQFARDWESAIPATVSSPLILAMCRGYERLFQ